MVKSAINMLLLVSAAWVTPRTLVAAKSCEQSNGFKYTECGSGATALCCKKREKCIGPVSPKTGADKYVCSQARQLSGQTAVKVVILPLMFMLMDVLFVVYMVMQLDFRANPVTKLCVGVISLSWPLYLSSLWAHGVWSAFLALLVAQMSNFIKEHKPRMPRFDINFMELPWWVYRLTWLMQLFQLIVLFGPTEAFHVPFFGQSAAGVYSNLVKGTPLTDKTCNTHYGDYFKVLAIEKQAKEADPDLEYSGLCTVEFLGFVQTMFIFQGLLWIVLVLATAPTLLSAGSKDQSGQSKDTEI